jgi:hypothetical protein
MDRYEYKSFTFPVSKPGDDSINELAVDGWHVVSSARLDDDRLWLLFERLLPAPPTG